jgi:hypothetical protein
MGRYFIHKESHYRLLLNVDDIVAKETGSRIASFSVQSVLHILQESPRRIPPIAKKQKLPTQRMKEESNITVIEVADVLELWVVFGFLGSRRREASRKR